MSKTVDEIRKKAHELNYDLAEEGFAPRDIEIIGYYLNRIAASYLSYFTHKELSESGEVSEEIIPKEEQPEEYEQPQ
jgi:hypothetical protein